MREYVDVNHNLTAWGKVLVSVISALKGNSELEEAAVMAVELLRLGILNDDNMFQDYNGAPMRGTGNPHHQVSKSNHSTDLVIDEDQRFNLLVSRVGGLGKLHHKPIGFTGPLSRHLLGYNSMIEAVRSTVRDMVEVCATHLFLTGCAERKVDNLPEIASKYVEIVTLTDSFAYLSPDFLSLSPTTALLALLSSRIWTSSSRSRTQIQLRQKHSSLRLHQLATSRSQRISRATCKVRSSFGMPSTKG